MSALRAALEGGWHLIPKATYQWRKAQVDIEPDTMTDDLGVRVDNGTGELAWLDAAHALTLGTLLIEWVAGQVEGAAREHAIAAFEHANTVRAMLDPEAADAYLNPPPDDER